MKDRLRKLQELILIKVALVLFFIIYYFDVTATNIGIITISFAMLIIIHSLSYLLIYVLHPELYNYLKLFMSKNFVGDKYFNTWQKTKIAISIISLYIIVFSILILINK